MKALKIKNLSKKYGENLVLDSVNLEIKKGDFCALLGHNGAGKTTIIGILTDLVKKDSGKVEVFGLNIDKKFSKAKSYIGVVPQEFNMNMWAKIKDVPVIHAGYYGIKKSVAIERTNKLFKELGLWEHRNKTAHQLSGGMKRRLMIVRALVHEPKFLILDEPTAGVDVELRKTMWDFIKKLNKNGTTILLTTHYLEEVESLCNTVIILDKGKIIKDTTITELLSSLDEEVFILTLKGKHQSKNLNTNFKNTLANFNIQFLSSKEIEVTISTDNTLNDLFQILSDFHIEIESMRNKTNRIEQLFINLTK